MLVIKMSIVSSLALKPLSIIFTLFHKANKEDAGEEIGHKQSHKERTL